MSTSRSICIGGLLAFAVGGAAFAQSEPSRGFLRTAPAYATGEERNRQTALRVMEVQFKPMRMIWVELTDPKTGQKQRQAVWYIVYRCIVRPSVGRLDETDTRPINLLDAPPRPSYFMPEFVITVYDDPKFERPVSSHMDQLLPEALGPIRKIEQRPASMFQKRQIEHALRLVQPFPEPIAEEAPLEEQDWLYGVATWSGIDPRTDYFTVTMRGFSNSFELRDAQNGEQVRWRRAIFQKFQLRGDEFDPTQREFEFIDGPVWDFAPDETAWRDWQPRPETLPEAAAAP